MRLSPVNRKYTLQSDYTYSKPLTQSEYDSVKEFICPDGHIKKSRKHGILYLEITVYEGFSWDGCSPKRLWRDIYIGTPDGVIIQETQLPITYYASLIHDFLYKHKRQNFMTRKEADLLFYQMLKEADFKLSQFYYEVVRLCGWVYGKW